jgi:hypothetical protein
MNHDEKKIKLVLLFNFKNLSLLDCIEDNIIYWLTFPPMVM